MVLRHRDRLRRIEHVAPAASRQLERAGGDQQSTAVAGYARRTAARDAAVAYRAVAETSGVVTAR